MATGSLLNLTDAVVTGRVKNGFALIRPPGHHAEPGYSSLEWRLMIDAAMGFCIYNNVGVAAKWALQKFPRQLRRILIIDWDVQYIRLMDTADIVTAMELKGYSMKILMSCISLSIVTTMALSVLLHHIPLI